MLSSLFCNLQQYEKVSAMFLQGGIQDDMLLRAPKECGESRPSLFSLSLRKGGPSADGLAEGEARLCWNLEHDARLNNAAVAENR